MKAMQSRRSPRFASAVAVTDYARRLLNRLREPQNSFMGNAAKYTQAN